ncbi:MAG TPA: bifunctional diguanylate cyclase/phosphodiesterase [Streptosporangiaceae bacterium]
MRDANDTRDIGPRIGSPLWNYITAVTVAGFGALLVAVRGLPGSGAAGLLDHPLLWVLAALALLGELKRIVTPGKSGPDAAALSVTFCFAALLYWGFPVAALLRAVTTLVVALAARRPVFRALFNVAQLTLSLAAAAVVLAAAHIHLAPARPWVPAGTQVAVVGLAAAAYFACNFLLVGVAAALHGRAPVLPTLRKALSYQAFVTLALLSAGPLVVVVMNRSVLLVLLFLLPLTAIYANAAMSLNREYQALHDHLTGLPNRTLLLRRTAEALAAASRTGAKCGFLLLDLDRFKEVNDTLGHPLGDGLLQVIAYRLARSVRPGDVVARLGGDEFAVLLPAVRTITVATEVAARLRAALAEPVRLEGMSFEIEASVGIALYPDDGVTVEVLLQRADVAMYLAKERRTGVETYVARADRYSPARLSLLGDLRRGIDQGEFELHYQPKVFLATGRTAGMEALVRWRHPHRGLIGPAEFIPLAEQSFLMRELTAHVVQLALRQASAWQRHGLAAQLAVNVSRRDLVGGSLAVTIERELAEQGLPAAALQLEISERALTRETAEIAGGLGALRALGIDLSVDDFGTGHSSVGRLKEMSIGEVKIDPSFTAGVANNPDTELIVRSAVHLLRGLGIRSVAEGVESPQVAATLRTMGCDAAQGWQFSRPLAAAAATAWLADRRPTPAPAPATGAATGAAVPAAMSAPGTGPGGRPAPAAPAVLPAPAVFAAPAAPAASGPLPASMLGAAPEPSPVPGDDCLDAAARP